MNTGQTIGAIVVAVFTVIATVVGATWIVLEEIGEVRIELHKENAEVRENIGGLRGDVGNVDTKLGAFIDSHRRGHDLFYDAAAKNDEENSTSAN